MVSTAEDTPPRQVPSASLHYGTDALAALQALPDESVHCIVTSPPYWGLRRYGGDHELGAEGNPSEYVARLARIMNEARRVLRKDGILALNLRDTYRDKGLQQIPERCAAALIEGGWILRDRITWRKPCGSENVRDRTVCRTEPIFLFSRSVQYFCDEIALRALTRNGALPTDVWEMAPETSVDHPAPFPVELPRRIILPWTSEVGCCPTCGAPWSRVVERKSNGESRKGGPSRYGDTPTGSARGYGRPSTPPPTFIHRGWEPTCGCPAHDPVPCVVLDPFAGSGSTGVAAVAAGRSFIGIDLQQSYLELAEARLAEAEVLFRLTGTKTVEPDR